MFARRIARWVRPPSAHGRPLAWLAALLVAIWTLFAGALVVGSNGALPAAGEANGGSVPLVLLGFALGTAGLLLLNPMPRGLRRRDED